MANRNLKESYNTLAADFSQTRSYPWPEFELFAPHLQRGGSLLDVGCGNGRVYEFIQPYKIDYTGLDFAEGLIDEGKKKYLDAKFIVSDMVQMPLEDDSFDQIWSIASFHHLPDKEKRMQCLSEMRRVLKPGGVLVMTCWNLLQKKYRPQLFDNFKDVLLRKKRSIFDFTIPWKDGEGNVIADRYYYAFSPRRLRKLLKAAGFTIVDEFYSLKGKKVSFLKSYNLCFVCRNEK